MSATAFAATKAAILAALVQAPALAGGRVYAERHRPLQAGDASFMVLRQATADGQETALGARDWTTRYALECYARATPGTDPTATLDPLLYDADARLGALDAAAIGATSLPPARQIDWQVDETDAPYACAVITFAVTHRTPTATMQPW